MIPCGFAYILPSKTCAAKRINMWELKDFIKISNTDIDLWVYKCSFSKVYFILFCRKMFSMVWCTSKHTKKTFFSDVMLEMGMSCRQNRQQKTTLKSLLILFQSVYINAYSFNNDLPSDVESPELNLENPFTDIVK